MKISEIKKRYYLIYWVENGKNRFYVKLCNGDEELENEVDKIKNMDYDYFISEHIDNKKISSSLNEYKILNRGKYPYIKRLMFLSGFILFLVLLYILILLYNHLN